MTLSDDYAGADANDEDKRPKSLRRRAASRLAAVQTLFQCWASQKDPTAIVPQFKDHFLPELLKEFDIASIDDGHYTNLVFGAYQEAEQIDAEIAPLLRDDWSIERLGEVERSVIRAAYIEFRNTPNIPARTVITEYTAIADSCGGDSNFVNAILDKFSHQYRKIEMENRQ
jgi:N utilization substance protein B